VARPTSLSVQPVPMARVPGLRYRLTTTDQLDGLHISRHGGGHHDALMVDGSPEGDTFAHAHRGWVARTPRPAYPSPPTSRRAWFEARRAPSSSARDLSAAASSTRAPAATPSQNSTAARS
jgi:hypothetical protein